MNQLRPCPVHLASAICDAQALKTSTFEAVHAAGTFELPHLQAGKTLQAQTLLAGRAWVVIEHNGQHYRLQTGRANLF